MKLLRYASGLAALVLILVLAQGGEPQVIIEERVRPVKTATAVVAPAAVKQRFAGSTKSASTFNVSFRVPGIITKFPAQVGVELEKGAIIARIDNNDYRIRVEQDKAELARQIVDAENTESRFGRVSALFEKDFVSAMDFESARAEYHVSKSEVFQARRDLELSREQLTDTSLRTPVEGCALSEATVAEHSNVDAGEVVAILSCGALMEVVSAVPEAAVSRLNIGQEVEVLLNAPREQLFEAKITDIGVSSSANGIYLVTARLLERNPLFRPGMSSELVLTRKFNVNHDHAWVPFFAVGEENDKHFVMVYEATEDSLGVVKKQYVDIDRHVMGAIEITSGVKVGTQVITAGVSQIEDGLTVKLLPQAQQSRTL